MKIAIMQPTYLPWLGYFDIMDQVDLFVFLDNVQFKKRSWQQRNRIKMEQGLEWLTVPVKVSGRYDQLIKDVEINDQKIWKKHLKSIELNYHRAPYFNEFFYLLADLYRKFVNMNRLADINIQIIKLLSTVLRIETSLICSSSIDVKGTRSVLLANICQQMEASEYLSPIGSVEYLLNEANEFQIRDINVLIHNYVHPQYNQLFPPFISFASVIDLIFNEGPNSLKIIRKGRQSTYLLDDIKQRK